MPPKAKFTKEEIIMAGLNIARREGISELTARSLGAELGCSARPVFTVFSGMEEVQKAVKDAARALYDEYVTAGLCSPMPFKGTGMAYIRFAREEPKLFQMLFMTETDENLKINGVLKRIDGNNEKILQAVVENYGLSIDAAGKFYRHLWIYSHGVATLLATKVCSFEEGEISEMLSEAARGILQKIKEQENDGNKKGNRN